MTRRRSLLLACAALPVGRMAHAHHGWSSFDQNRPIYLAGRAIEVRWRNPHAELVLERPAELSVPADLATRPVPAQTSPVDGAALMRAAVVPTRADRRWTIELAPLSRMNAWQVPQIEPGTALSVVGFTFADERGEAVMRVEYLMLGDRTYGLRSSPA